AAWLLHGCRTPIPPRGRGRHRFRQGDDWSTEGSVRKDSRRPVRPLVQVRPFGVAEPDRSHRCRVRRSDLGRMRRSSLHSVVLGREVRRIAAIAENKSSATGPQLHLDLLREQRSCPCDGFEHAFHAEKLVDLGKRKYAMIVVRDLVGPIDDGGFDLDEDWSLSFCNPFRGDRRHRQHSEAEPLYLPRTVGSKAALDVEHEPGVLYLVYDEEVRPVSLGGMDAGRKPDPPGHMPGGPFQHLHRRWNDRHWPWRKQAHRRILVDCIGDRQFEQPTLLHHAGTKEAEQWSVFSERRIVPYRAGLSRLDQLRNQ